ncbi:MAG: efflux transporter outer membrane subunit [Pseudomonadota bacterium]
MTKINPGRRARLALWMISSSVGLSACSTEEPFIAPFFNFAPSYQSGIEAAPVLLTNDAWWEDLHDKTLNHLVDTALDDNIDLGIARERVIEALSVLEGVPPNAEINPSLSAQRGETAGVATSSETTSSASLGVFWMLDPYGIRRQSIQAAGARVEVADAEVDAARQLIILNLTSAYVDLRFNQRLLELRKRQLASRRQTLELTRKLFEQGSAIKVELTRTEALLAETQSQIPPLVAAVQSLKNDIAILTGVAPGQLGINLDGHVHQPHPKMPTDIGIPADILRNRPDLRIAERNYYAEVSDIGIARADLFPQLSLSGSVGPARNEGVTEIEYFFGPSIIFPSLLDNSLKANVAVQVSQARQAHETWKSTVLSALGEVENALASYRGSAGSVTQARRSAQLFVSARNLTRQLVESGEGTVRELIDVEQDVANADVALAQALQQLGQNYVALHTSLGAGSNVKGEKDSPVTAEKETEN